ncbi:MAG: diversity-generating retroelement protein Avd [Rhodospirillales bacterium]|nr:diversity-generating retroelement protein Avd [Rhodospirillales bacterium]
MAEEMVIFARTFDLLEWLLPKSERFPRGYRFTLTQRMMDAALDLQEALITAETRQGRSRLAALRDADAALGRLRVYLRLAHRWRWLSDGQYAHAGGMVGEIGRLLGGWLKAETG